MEALVRASRRPCGDRISHSFSSRPPLSCGCSLSPGITTTKRSPNVTSSAQPQATTATTRDRRRPRDEGSDMARSKRTGPNASKRQPNVTEGRRRPRPLDEDYGVVLGERSQSQVTKAKRKPNRHVQGSIFSPPAENRLKLLRDPSKTSTCVCVFDFRLPTVLVSAFQQGREGRRTPAAHERPECCRVACAAMGASSCELTVVGSGARGVDTACAFNNQRPEHI